MSQPVPNFRRIRQVVVVPHQPEWAHFFVKEASRLAELFGAEVVRIYHVGSTAIDGIRAKPIIDLLIEVRSIDRIEAYNAAMAELGYEAAGEFGVAGRRFFSRTEYDRRTHNVHIFETGHPEIQRLLNLRDYLNAHPEEAQAYSRLKEELARQFPDDIESYVEGKTDFIREIDARAAAWRASDDS